MYVMSSACLLFSSFSNFHDYLHVFLLPLCFLVLISKDFASHGTLPSASSDSCTYLKLLLLAPL